MSGRTIADRFADLAVVILLGAVMMLLALAAPVRGQSLTAGSGPAAQAAGLPVEPPHYVRVTSKNSLLHLGSLDSFDITPSGTKAAELLYDCLSNKRAESARGAMQIYERIIPTESFGGEYTALEWLCKHFLASPAEQQAMRANPVVDRWYQYLSADDFKPLKEYLKQKYHLQEWKHKKTPKSEANYRFLEDFILFNNPQRERWEKTSQMIAALGLKPGDAVADLGCGPGYYTFKFAELVGEKGFVYAIDTNTQHTQYVDQLVKDFGLKNVETFTPVGLDWDLDKKVDLVYLCSLYHNIYGLTDGNERGRFLGAIKRALKPGGRLVLVDNDLVEDNTLPYHGPYIAKDLVINQLWFYGLRLVGSYQFIPQRYMLVFESGPEPPPQMPRELPPDGVATSSKASLLRILKTTTFPGFTIEGRNAAREFLAALEQNDRQRLTACLATYRDLTAKERFGDEYTAFQWFCEYLLASATEREALLSDWLVRDYHAYLAADDYRILKLYLRYKYFLDQDLDAQRMSMQDELEIPKSSGINLNQIIEWGEFIAYNNPHREQWEKTSQVLDFLKIKPGQHVADLGSGSGYYTFRFSKLVGPEGRVYAVDTVQACLDLVNRLASKHGVGNIRTVMGADNTTNLPANSVDMVYICSMYHAAYLISMEYVKDAFVASIKQALKPGGRLVIADNDILEGPGELPYYGPGIDKKLIILQMKHYGLRLVDQAQFIPQRYVLVFEKE